MKNSRLVLTLTVSIVAFLMVARVSHAASSDAVDALSKRMAYIDKVIKLPPSVSLDQRWLQIAAISAFETQTNDASVITDAYLEAGALVTYYLHADTTYFWNAIESVWMVTSRTLYTYTGGNLTETLEQDYDTSNGWVSSGLTVSTYDGSNRLATTTYSYWDQGVLTNLFKFLYSYNGSGLISQVIYQSWIGSAWVDSDRSTATYSGGKITSMLNEHWNGATWQNHSQTLFTYSGSNLTETLTQLWTGTAWNDQTRTTNTYSGSNITQSIDQEWNGSVWVNTKRSDMTYAGSNMTLSVGYNWVSNAWSYSDSDTLRYDGSNRVIEEVSVTHSDIFDNVLRTLNTYDGAGNLIETLTQFVFFGTTQDATRTTYFYSTSGVFDDDAAAGIPMSFALEQNYPNPFNLSTVIPYSLAGDNHVRVTVSNILGQTVSTIVDEFQIGGPHTAVWDGHDSDGREVSSGVYFFRVQVGGYAQVRKMVLLK